MLLPLTALQILAALHGNDVVGYATVLTDGKTDEATPYVSYECAGLACGERLGVVTVKGEMVAVTTALNNEE